MTYTMILCPKSDNFNTENIKSQESPFCFLSVIQGTAFAEINSSENLFSNKPEEQSSTGLPVGIYIVREKMKIFNALNSKLSHY